MRSIARVLITPLLVCSFLSSALPCGPSSTTPLFETSNAPESPYTDFASGRLGIIQPKFRRSVLYAAYRYINGGSFSPDEQQAMIQMWRAEIDRDYKDDDGTSDVIKAWVDKRVDVVGKDAKVPEIYAERSYGGYDFFPNCTKNAFETAIATLSDRVSAHGPNDSGVTAWLNGQDAVFSNCSSGKQTPADLPPGSPDWLQKDRAYQKAAAEFYALDYVSARKHFAEIALDTDSPWQDTANYLVVRTIIRQASTTKSPAKANALYDEAEARLQQFVSSTGKFGPSADRMMGLVRFRRHPKERVGELAKKLTFESGNDNFKQDLVDYNWLLDKFEAEVLTAEDKRKEEEAARKDPAGHPPTPTPEPTPASGKKNEDDLEIYVYSSEQSKSYTVYVKYDATDDEAIAEAERVVGSPLTEEMKKSVRESRQTAYSARFTSKVNPEYQGSYYGESKLDQKLLPAFLRQDDLTDWLYTYRMTGSAAYLYSLNKFKATGSQLWLMTALRHAERTSNGLGELLAAGNNVSRISPAYVTVAYHMSRLYLETGKRPEARKLIDDMLNAGDQIPLSARNAFQALRLKFAETLEDFLANAVRKPYAFDFGGTVGSVEQVIAEQKKWYNPEYNTDGREAYDAEVEARFKTEKLWQDRAIFDSDVIDLFNQQFPTSTLIDVERSPALPEYMRERFALAIWMRSFVSDDMATLLKMTPEVARLHPEFAADLEKVTAATTQSAQDHAVLYFVLKNPILSPFIDDGIGRTDNEMGDMDANDWWCAPTDTEYNEATSSEVPKALAPRPAFLTPAQVKAAQTERDKLKAAGDAPKYLANKVLEWAKQFPTDKRVPEALFIAIHANGWTKYGCGNDTDLHDQMSAYLKKAYPGNEWTSKLIAEETEK